MSRWLRRMERTARGFDLVIEVCPVPMKELMRPLTAEDERADAWRTERIARALAFGQTHRSVALTDEVAARTMEMAARRLSFTAGQYAAILRAARAVANLDQSERLQARHVAEAVQYNCYMRYLDRRAS